MPAVITKPHAAPLPVTITAKPVVHIGGTFFRLPRTSLGRAIPAKPAKPATLA